MDRSTPWRCLTAAILAAQALAAHPLAAQSVLVPRLAIGAGPIVNGARTPPLPSGALWQLGAEWVQRGGRPAWRLNLEGWRQESAVPAFGVTDYGCDASCLVSSHAAILGLSFDGKYELTRGRVRPYVASGVGVYRVATVAVSNYLCGWSEADGQATCRLTPNGVSVRSPGAVEHTLGLHAALGASVAVGRMRPFAELRVQASPRPYQAPPRHLFPFMIGVRF